MKLKELRSKKNISQTEIANILKITQEKYSRIENEKTQPEVSLLIELADYYNTTIDNLVGRTTKNDLYISQEKKELHQMIEQLNERNYFQARIYVSGLLAGQI